MPGRPPPVNVQANRGFEVSRANLRDATIVFDLDGTLVDTAPDLTKALNDALTRRDLAGDHPLCRRVGRSRDDRGSLAPRRRRRRHRQMLAEVLVHYEANIAAESRPFPGAVASLEGGARLSVCTNKREYLSRKLLEALGLQYYFHSVAGHNTFAVSKPDQATSPM
jgi:phosphoglycolate phosphatase